MSIRISELTPKGANLEATDLLEISESTPDGFVSKSITGAEIITTAQEGLQPTLVSGTNIKTINGNSLLGSGDLTISGGGGLTIGTTAITSGTIGRILFEGTGNVLQESANLFWDNTNGRLGINTASPNMSLDIRTGNVGIGVTSNAGYKLDVNGTSRFSGLMLIANGLQFGQTGAESYLNTTGATAIQINRKNITVSNGADNQLTIDAGNGGSTITKIFVGGASGTQPICINGNGRETVFGLDTATPSTSALIRMESTTKGFLPPRMTTAQKNAIASPASGLIVYDTTLNKLCVYTTTWETITST